MDTQNQKPRPIKQAFRKAVARAAIVFGPFFMPSMPIHKTSRQPDPKIAPPDPTKYYTETIGKPNPPLELKPRKTFAQWVGAFPQDPKRPQ